MSSSHEAVPGQILDPFSVGISSGMGNIFDAYLGQPRSGKTNPMEKRNVTTWDMPEAYEGKSLFLGTFFLYAIGQNFAETTNISAKF
jgi:hypothetical protein